MEPDEHSAERFGSVPETKAASRASRVVRHAAGGRTLRVGALGGGLTLGLVLASPGVGALTDWPFVAGVVLFLAGTALTMVRSFHWLGHIALTVVPLLDISTLCFIAMIPGVQVVYALVALPAMWLGMALGWRGIPVAVAAGAALATVPDLVRAGMPEPGWASAVSITLFAGIAAAGIALTTQVSSQQIHRLEDQRAELRHAVHVKDDFIALVSHELRPPLSSIIGYLELETEQVDVSQEAAHYLAAASRNAERLKVLVNELLTASAAESAPMRLTLADLDVGDLVHQCLGAVGRQATATGVRLLSRIEPRLVIRADSARLSRAFEHVLSNALKFTPVGGTIVAALQRRDDGVELVVTDTGVGIDPDTMHRLGENFTRSRHATHQAIPGIGLGLATTRNIVVAHGGTLSVSSNDSLGTIVRIRLPVMPPQPARDQARG